VLTCCHGSGGKQSKGKENEEAIQRKEKKKKKKNSIKNRACWKWEKKERKKHQILVPYRYCGALQSRGKNTSEY